ncbi:outer membrane beta-barrel protein [Pedobacter nyackensis]|uniref:outer membrane beta-barrel protein n=1 Tax=Pedobacter nyackensis TaxID=475255 RepID=UPI002930A0F8|nr:outer membrane beta-barrel protein [Pedobacter nyackensis]
MKPVEDELFAHIKESLAEHEEAYTPGAWERFEKKERKRTGWIWFAGLSSAAAVLLIGFTLFYTADKTQDNELPQQVNNNASKQNTDVVKGSETAPLTAIENLETKITENRNIVEQRTNSNVPNDPLIVVTKPSVTNARAVVPIVQPVVSDAPGIPSNPKVNGFGDKKEVIVATSEVVAKAVANEKDSAKTNKPRSFEEFLDAEVKSNSAVAALKSSAKKGDKWEMGLMVAPSMGNSKKLNMGYGLSMDYALSDKISISSGISYNEMAATKSIGGNNRMMDAPGPPMTMASSTKNLKSVDANLVGIDIPLGLKYHLSKKFYTNVGVSAFAVLNQKQNNNYVQGGVEYVPTNESNVAGFKAVFQEKTVSEPVPTGEIRGDKYLGFYNVSFGFKQQISGSKAFSVEPFMKLPMKEFTKENLYLIGTGVRLKFDF